MGPNDLRLEQSLEITFPHFNHLIMSRTHKNNNYTEMTWFNTAHFIKLIDTNRGITGAKTIQTRTDRRDPHQFRKRTRTTKIAYRTPTLTFIERCSECFLYLHVRTVKIIFLKQKWAWKRNISISSKWWFHASLSSLPWEENFPLMFVAASWACSVGSSVLSSKRKQQGNTSSVLFI